MTKPWLWPQAAYLHVPFCAHHCGYCDFAVVTGQDHLMDLYLEALGAEMARLGRPQPMQTLFIGGGTPTYLDAPKLERLLQEVNRWLPLVPSGEFSVEANPDSLDAEKVSVLADHGVNRVSLGAQSFHPHMLRVLERQHEPAAVPRAVAQIKQRIACVSLDLIFGVPGQTTAIWQADIEQGLALQPDHLSTYGLTYEKGTRLWKQRQRGEIQSLDEETERTLYLAAMDTLERADFEQYEISSFARLPPHPALSPQGRGVGVRGPGHRCRHNEVYWANHAYFGFGLGAARYVEGRRELNTRDLQTYLRKTLSGETPTFQSEVLAPEERARETLALQLRRAEGIDRLVFQEQAGFELDALAGEAIGRHVTLGLLQDDGATVRLTREGKCVADSVIENLI